jgi:hypothetical protein|tara:strand:- start:325 stop:738 length:414 start_codon:yes stop_codon:yes gene_type:complete
MSSKFSSPFFQKSPLLGAYSSGAGGMVTISNAADIQKMQDGILGGTLAAIGGQKEKGKLEDQISSKNKLGTFKSELVAGTKDAKGVDITVAAVAADTKRLNDEALNKHNITYNKSNKCDGYETGTIIGTGSKQITCP